MHVKRREEGDRTSVREREREKSGGVVIVALGGVRKREKKGLLIFGDHLSLSSNGEETKGTGGPVEVIPQPRTYASRHDHFVDSATAAHGV
ncbi:hypothetical protein F0562_014505 [Nyssa sinensis]|uniref:Uncharacterized protein n=1 Tax=Nyssa sinensis TaxID=561372 RepID=A0A5J4ZQH0_9ASTE|nr:hypothetical protein F0562_014505 [Nyssa sinensis]